MFSVEAVKPVLTLEGGVSQGGGPEPTRPPAILAPPDSANPVGGNVPTFSLVPVAETEPVSAGSHGGSRENALSGEIFVNPSPVLRMVKYFESYAHSGIPGTGGEECKHGTQRLIQQVSAENITFSSGQLLLLDNPKQVSSICDAPFSEIADFSESSSLQVPQDVPMNSLQVGVADSSMADYNPGDQGLGGLPMERVMNFIESGVPTEIFFMPNGERYPPTQERSNLAEWGRNQYCQGGEMEEDPSEISPRDKSVRPRETPLSVSSSPDKKRLKEGGDEMDTSESDFAVPLGFMNPVLDHVDDYEESETCEGGDCDQNILWNRWVAQVTSQMQNFLTRLEGLEGRLTPENTHLLHQHMFESLETARKQCDDFLESESIKITDALNERAELLYQQILQKVEKKMNELFERHQLHLTEISANGNAEMAGRIDGLQISMQKILELLSAQESLRKSDLERFQQFQISLEKLSGAVQGQANFVNHNMQLVNQNFQVITQQVQHIFTQISQKFQVIDGVLQKSHQDLENKFVGSQNATARDLHDLGRSLQSLQINLESCKSQDNLIQGQVLQVQHGVQSALGQVASQVQQADMHTRILENQVSEMRGAILQKSQPVDVAPKPTVIVPLTINVDKSAMHNEAKDKLVATPAVLECFRLEPLEDGLSPFLQGPFCASAQPGGCGHNGSSFSVQQVTTAPPAGKQGTHFSGFPFMTDPVSQKIACNLEEPHFDGKRSQWLNFVSSWNSYWEQLSQWGEYPEVKKLQILERCLCSRLQEEIRLMKINGQKPGFTTVFAWLRATYGSDLSTEARKTWQEVFLSPGGRIGPDDWREFWTKFCIAKSYVKDASEDETYRLLLSRIPEFIAKWVYEENCKRCSKKPRVRLHAIPNLPDESIIKSVEQLIQVTPKAVKQIGDAEYLIDFDSHEDAQKLLLLDGRSIMGHNQPLSAQAVKYRMTPEEVNRFVYDKFCTLEEVKEMAGGAKDFFPSRPPRNGKFSTRICSMEEGGGEVIPANFSVNKLTSSVNPGNLDSSVPLRQAGTPAAQTQASSSSEFVCYGCGGAGHIKRNCPNSARNQWDGHVPGGKGKGGKGFPQPVFSKGSGGKGKGKGEGKGGAVAPGNFGRGSGKGSQPPSASVPRPQMSNAEVQCSESQ